MRTSPAARPTGEATSAVRAFKPLLLAALAFAACAPACAPPAEVPGAHRGPPSSDAKAARDPMPMPPPEEMIREAPGVDLRGLSEAQTSTFFQVINTEPSACDKPHSLAKSLKEDAQCRDSLLVAQFVADSLQGGAAVSDIREVIPQVEDSLRAKTIKTTGRPVFGADNARVEVVVFADFECPHCRMEAPGLRQAVQQFRGMAKLVFKHFPLQMHEFAKRAAMACEAAHLQGKFWQMHDIVFANQTALTDEDIRRYAKQIGLDMPKFESDWNSDAVKAAVEADRADGEALDISGTPAVFVNGRALSPFLFGGTVEGHIEEALRR